MSIRNSFHIDGLQPISRDWEERGLTVKLVQRIMNN